METITWYCIHFNDLTNTQLYALLQLRAEVFVVEQNCPYNDCDGKDHVSWHVLGYDSVGELVAVSRIVPKGVAYPNEPSIGRVLAAQKVRKTGMGKWLMEKSRQYCEGIFGRTDIRIGAQSYLLHFYGNLGYVSTGKNYLEDGIPHTEMVYHALPI